MAVASITFIHMDGQGGMTTEDMDLDEDSEVKGLYSLTQFIRDNEPNSFAPGGSDGTISDGTISNGTISNEFDGEGDDGQDEGREDDEEIDSQGNITQAAARVGIPRTTVQRKVAQFEEDPEKCLPGRTPSALKPGTTAGLMEVHTIYICDFLNSNPTAHLGVVLDALIQQFPDLKTSKTALHRHIQDHCRYTLKRAVMISDHRNAQETLDKREAWAKEWTERQEEFALGSVFIDEAGFHTHQLRSVAWSPKGKRACIKAPSNRGRSITIFGAICIQGTVKISARLPMASKKRKVVGGSKTGKGRSISGGTGTKANHYLEFITSVMDELDLHNLQGCNLVMDNAAIHKTKALL
ncbi:hypothetical protein BGZ99_002797, partial [Dissophora globulifera]